MYPKDSLKWSQDMRNSPSPRCWKVTCASVTSISVTSVRMIHRSHSWPESWPLIGPHRSRDLNTGLWLVTCHQLVFWLAEDPATLCLHQDVTSSLPWSDAENFIVTHLASLLDVFGSVRNSRNANVCWCDPLPLSLSTKNQMRSLKI